MANLELLLDDLCCGDGQCHIAAEFMLAHTDSIIERCLVTALNGIVCQHRPHYVIGPLGE